MSEEGDSTKISSSEGKEKIPLGDNTDSSQDEIDVKDKIPAKETQNNVDKKEENGDGDKNTNSDDAESQDSKSGDKVKEEPPAKDVKNEKKKANEKDEASENDESPEEDAEEETDKKVKNRKGKTAASESDKNSNKKDEKNSKAKNDDEDDEDDEEEEDEEEEEKHEKSCLGDIPRIDASISRFKNDDLKLLHKLLYREPGKTTMIKKNIRKFDGFDFTKDSDEYSKKFKEILKFESKQLKVVCEMLDLPKSEKDEENARKILDFLLEPKDSGKPVAGGRPKRTAAVRANNRGYSSHDDYSSDEKYKPRSRRDKGQRATYKEETSSSDEEFQPSDEDNSPPRSRKGNKRKKPKSDESEDELATPSSDESDDGSRKRKRPTRANNKSKAKTPAKRGRKPLPKKTTGRKKKKVSSEDEDDLSDKKDESSSEDEPLVKKTKNSKPPTDDEIKNFVKEILEGANLEEITMKTVCQKVYAHYPDFDLAHKKDFIKATVKSLIST